MDQPQHATVEKFTEKGQTLVKVRGRLDRESAPAVLDWIEAWMPKKAGRVGLDLGEVDYLDSAGVAVLAESLYLAKRRGCELSLVKVSEQARRTLDLFRFKGELQDQVRVSEGFLANLGDGLIKRVAKIKEIMVLMADTFYWAIVGPMS